MAEELEPLPLDDEDEALLAGARGPGAARAMEIVAALARVQGAKRLVRIASAHVSGVSYRNIGEPGLHFLKTLAQGVEGLAAPATINPGGVDFEAWRELGADPAFVDGQRRIVDVLASMGFDPILSCAPYHCGYAPARGEVLAWAESSAVSFANSALGARTQREGGPAALAAAITGKTAAAGVVLDAGRRPTLAVDVEAAIRTAADAGALGAIVGPRAAGGVPHFRGVLPPGQETEALRALGASMAASGSVALFHFDGVTPEAMDALELDPTLARIVVDDLAAGYALPGLKRSGPVDLVALGCPHASLDEIGEIAATLAGRRMKSALWLMTSRSVAKRAEAEGFGEAIRKAGGRIVCDTCIVVAPLEALGFHAVATDSAKAATYLPSHQHVETFFGNRETCLRAAERSFF